MKYITPPYGDEKQIEYRNEVFKRVVKYYPSKTISKWIVSLGGAHALENIVSIERKLLRYNKNHCIVIVENNPDCVKHLNKSLKKLATQFQERIIIYEGTLSEYLLDEDQPRIDILIADYLWTFNETTLTDLEYCLTKGILNDNAQLFITASYLTRTKNSGIVQWVESNGKDYKSGMINICQSLIKETNCKLQRKIQHWEYVNDSVYKLNLPEHCKPVMHILDIKLKKVA